MNYMYVTDKGYLHVTCDFENKDIVTKAGGQWNSKSKNWTVAFTSQNIEYLLDNIPDMEITQELQTQVESLLEKEDKLDEIKKLAKEDKKIDFDIPGWNKNMPPYNYQKLGIMFSIENGQGVLLADDMGLGKSTIGSCCVSTTSGRISHGEIWENLTNKDTFYDDEEGEWFDLNKPLEVLGCVDGENKFQKANKIYREKVNKTAVIILRGGQEIKVGYNHKYMTQDGWKRVRDLKKTDWVLNTKSVDVVNPHCINDDIAEFMGWVISEGYEAKGNKISITNTDKEVIDRLVEIVKNNQYIFEHDCKVSKPRIRSKCKNAWTFSIASPKFKKYLIEELGYEWGKLSGDKVIPKKIEDCNISALIKFTQAYFEGDGCCNKSNIELSSKSKKVIESFRYILRRFGIFSISSFKIVETRRWGKSKYWRLNIGGQFAQEFKNKIGFLSDRKKEKLEILCAKKTNTNYGNSIPARNLYKEIIQLTDLSTRAVGINSDVYLKTQYPSREHVLGVISHIDEILLNGLEFANNPRWQKRKQASAKKIENNRIRIQEIVSSLKEMCKKDFLWLQVEDIKNINKEEWVYDLSIENGEHNYYTELALGHNTLQALGTAVYKKHTEGMKSCLIITPASVKWNWPLEIEKFTNEKYVIIDGTPAKREEQWLREDVFFYVANYELIVEDLGAGKEVKIKASDTAEQIEKKELKKIKSQQRARKLAPVARRNWGMISVDECHMMKSHRSKRTEAIKGLTTDFKLGLTGTPMDGRLEEIHSIMEWICPGLFMSKHRFMLKHASTDFWGRVTGYHDIDIVKEKIAPFFLRRLKRDVLKDLPEKIYVNRYVKLSPKELKTYKQIAKREHEVTEDDEAIVAAIRCKQFCDFPNWVIEDEKYANTKLESFKELLEEVVVLGCHKTIVFSQYTTMCEELIKIIEEMKLKYYYICGDTNTKERVDMCEDFNTNPQMDVIIGTEAMSTGLNITGATYVINYDDNWSPAFMKQREDRAYRNGQKNAVTVVNFICKDTIEERIRTALYEKDKVSNETLGDESDMATLKRMTQDEIFGLL